MKAEGKNLWSTNSFYNMCSIDDVILENYSAAKMFINSFY